MLSRCVWALALIVSLGAGGLQAEEKRLLRVDDLYRADAVTELALSPDQQQAVYTRDWAEPGMKLRRQAIWRVNGSRDQRRPLEEGEPDGRRPIWSPDGKWIAFLSMRPFPDGSPAFTPVPPYSDIATDIWLIPASGGKAIPLGGKNKPYGRVLGDTFYSRIAFSPDGRQLVFVADDGRDQRTPAEVAANITIVRQDQGEGYKGYGTARLWVAELADAPTDVAARSVRCLTNDDAWYGDPQWSPDGTYLVAHANRTDDRESVRFSINKNYDLWRIDVASGAITQLTTGPGPEVSPRLSPDGRRLVCLSVPRKGPHADVYNLLVMDLSPGGMNSRVLFDHHGPGAEPPPHLPPAFPLPADPWLAEGRIWFDALAGIKSERQIVSLLPGAKPVAESSAEPKRLADERAARQRLSPPSNPYLSEIRPANHQFFRWKSSDGLEIDGALTLPPEGVAERPFKLLVYPHGGPHSRSSVGSNFTAEIFAANGYAVFQPNFRGTSGYGRKFLDADRFDLGGGDMQDILTGVDALVCDGIVDRRRQFVYGISYGGFMTNWLVGHTNQFRAAATQNSVTDMNAMWGLSDLQSWTEWELGGLPWEVPIAMRERSPVTYAAQIKTPTLILHADHDARCPLPMGMLFYRALNKAGCKTEMVIYHDERHGLIQLPHQEDVYRRVLDWFAAHDIKER